LRAGGRPGSPSPSLRFITRRRWRCGSGSRFGPVWILLLATVAGCRSARGGQAAAGGLLVSHAVVPLPPSPVEGSAFLVVENRSATLNALTGSQSPLADSVVIHDVTGGRMTPVSRIEIPAHGRVALIPGSYHLMLGGVRRSLAIGDTVPILLRFASGEVITVGAPVLRYTDAVNDLPER